MKNKKQWRATRQEKNNCDTELQPKNLLHFNSLFQKERYELQILHWQTRLFLHLKDWEKVSLYLTVCWLPVKHGKTVQNDKWKMTVLYILKEEKKPTICFFVHLQRLYLSLKCIIRPLGCYK